MDKMKMALTTIGEFPITDEHRNPDALNMRKIAKDALVTAGMSDEQAKAHPIDGYDNLDIDRVAAALRLRLQGGKQLLPWSDINNASRKKWRDLAEFTLNQYRIAKADRDVPALAKAA